MMFLQKADIKTSKILIVDDEPINLIVVSELLDMDKYSNVTAIEDPYKAVDAYQQNDFDLILLDVNMPGLDGFAVMDKFSEIFKPSPPPVLVLTAQADKEIRYKALKGGARDFLLKPFDTEEILSRVYNLLEMHHSQKIIQGYNQNLEKVVKKRTQDLLDTQLEIVLRLGMAAEYRDTETANHTVRVGEYSRIIGQVLGVSGVALEYLHHAAPMYDIGKIGVADDLLRKQGKFTPDERLEMEKHTTIGSNILEGSSSELLLVAQEIALNHHERWDGTGYPAGLKGKNIPLNGRIVMVADVFDALTMERPYKHAWPISEAVEFISDNSGSMFDPAVVNAFNSELEKIINIKNHFFD